MSKLWRCESVYQKLREKYTDEEIADSMLIPADLTDEKKRIGRRDEANQDAEVKRNDGRGPDIIRCYEVEISKG